MPDTKEERNRSAVLFEDLPLRGSHLVELEPVHDDRGFNARAWCAREFEERGLTTRMVQTNVVHSRSRGTLRGMHYQVSPMAEAKLIRVTRGSIFDVIVDLVPDSPTYRHWTGVELRADSYRMLYMPEGFAHGFVTLEDDTEATYQVSAYYSPEYARGFRHDDPAFGIEWPRSDEVISEKDRSWPDFEPVHQEAR
jgi:dTDP-4-dehydrorhamnose 3,5-epimerase